MVCKYIERLFSSRPRHAQYDTSHSLSLDQEDLEFAETSGHLLKCRHPRYPPSSSKKVKLDVRWNYE